MQDRIFGERGKAMEEVYFRDQDAKLVKKLRQRARLDEIALAIGEKLLVDDPDLLMRVKDLGVTLDTAPALFLAPLVQAAWAEGKVTRQKHDAVLRIAGRRGMESHSSAYAQLEEWLHARPGDALFDTALEVLKLGYGVLPLAEREERIKDVVRACREVAEAPAGLERWFGFGGDISAAEASTIGHIARSLRGHE